MGWVRSEIFVQLLNLCETFQKSSTIISCVLIIYSSNMPAIHLHDINAFRV